MPEVSLAKSQLMLLAGTANRPLAEEIAAELKQPLGQVTIRRFADGELFVKIDENVRGRDVYILQPTNPPAENLIELLLLIDAAHRASGETPEAVQDAVTALCSIASEIAAVVPPAERLLIGEMPR